MSSRFLESVEDDDAFSICDSSEGEAGALSLCFSVDAGASVRRVWRDH